MTGSRFESVIKSTRLVDGSDMNVPLLDLKAQFSCIEEEVRAAMDSVLASQHFIMGPQVKECEKQIAAYCQCASGVGVSSGTDALLAALMAEGIGTGDEVITTPYTFFATVGSIVRLGARPVFVDIDPITFNLRHEDVEARVTLRTRAIIPVHLYGQTADMDPLMEMARRKGLVVIEDAAQAIGAEYNGRRAGSLGDYGCVSFFPSKNLGCFGDGGMIVTKDPVKAERVAILRSHGSKPKYYHRIVGGNFRLDTLQAAVICTKLRHLDDWTGRRQANAKRYEKLFRMAGLVCAECSIYPTPEGIVLPEVCMTRHVFNQYVIRVAKRDELQVYLKEKGIGTEVYYPVPMHLQECFAYLGYKSGDLPESERAAKESLALPIYPELTDVQAEYVVESISAFCRGH